MGAPKGYLMVPIGENPDGDLRSLELTVDDFLRVNVEGGTLTVAKHNILDGDVHGDSVAKAVTRGGVLVGSSAPAWDRLDLGADNAILASDGSDLAYETLAWLLKAAVLTSNGDILIRDNSGNVIRLAKGSDGEYLKLVSGAAAWASVVGGYDEGARVYRTNAATISNVTWTTVDFDLERYDTDSIHDPASNPSRLTCKTAGVYYMQAQLTWASHATGNRYCRIVFSGGGNIAVINQNTTTGDATSQSIASIYKLAVDEYITCQFYQSSGGDLDGIVSGQDSMEFMMQRIGAG